MTTVLLATCRTWPEGEPGGHLLVTAFAAAGAAARWVCWDDPDVDWSTADVVAARSTWDYLERREEFLAWADGIGASLVNGAVVFAWNTDKRYLIELAAAGLPVVPTAVVEGAEGLPAAIAAHRSTVVKPTVSAGGLGVLVVDAGGLADLDEAALGPGPWVVQPMVASVRSEGEHSVFVLGGEPVTQADKHPARKRPGGADPAEIRVHEQYGGRTVVVELDAAAADLARSTVEAVGRLLDVELAYARVDMLRLDDGSLAVSELEATEPGLYLEELPENADRFVRAVLSPARR